MTPKPSKTGREKIASPIRKVDAQSTTKEETRLQVIAHYNYTGVVVGQSDLSALRLWASPLRTPKRKRANKDLIVTNKTKNNGNKKQHTYQALQHIIERGSQPKNTRIYAKYRRDKNLPRSSTCSRQRALDKPTLWRLRLAERKTKSGKIIKVAGCSPIREGVLLIKPDTTLEDVRRFGEECQERWGITPLQIFLHKDEGHWLAGEPSQTIRRVFKSVVVDSNPIITLISFSIG